jgi:hypothetical protein
MGRYIKIGLAQCYTAEADATRPSSPLLTGDPHLPSAFRVEAEAKVQ